MHYIIYQTTNLINGKIYIGCHKTKTLDDGYLGSGKLLKQAIIKYGKDNFKRDILYECSSSDEMFSMESKIVNMNFISRNDVYNIATGGHGYLNFGVIGNTIENRTKAINTLKNNYTEDELSLQGKKARKALSDKYDKEYLSRHFKNLGECSFKGRAHSNESKEKIGRANSILQKGSNNSQFGKCWIYNGQFNNKIDKNELTVWLNDGWQCGRKMHLPMYTKI